MRVAIASAVRTPIGNFGGSLRTVPAYDLAAIVLNEAARRADVKPESVDIVFMGQNYQNGEYVNIARMSLLTAGWPVEVVGLTNDRRCPSGLDAICLASMTIETGNAAIAVAGGVESMSTAELYLKGDIRWGLGGAGDMPKGHGSLTTWGMPLYDRALRGRVMSQPEKRFGIVPSMMAWAEAAAAEHGIPREEVDRWALLSNQRAWAAIESGTFKEEIIPVPVPQPKGEPLQFSQDERPRSDTNAAALAKLKPVLGGVCTAGNSCGENDGASACVVMSEEKAEELQGRPLAYLKGFAFSGSDPRYAWRAATSAVKKALQKTGLSLKDIDLIEVHEAFAAQALANFRELGLTEKDYDRINVNGSCVSLGHPLGATGARIVTTLTHEMRRRTVRYGLIAMCGGGGMGVAGVLERV
ncbi:MAG: acetyl-CoA C-acyltransferase [Deltaproteobacteria bacterium]|nr:acetyl-CoA C-acyltransferase [Deltaproteobacteria bacterium]